MRARYKLGVLLGIIGVISLATVIARQWRPSGECRTWPAESPDQGGRVRTMDVNDTFDQAKLTDAVSSKQEAPDLREEAENPVVLHSNSSKLELPLPLTENEIECMIARMKAMELWGAQDATIRSRPDYSEVRELLLKELGRELDLENLSGEELAGKAIEFRKMFWEAGGLFSRLSWRAAYKARLLLELAHSRTPENLGITDELVETIQAAYPAVMFDEQTRERIRNEETSEVLMEVRLQQFDQIKKEIQQGGKPSVNDFIRVVDLAVLYSIYDNAKAKSVLEWLQNNAKTGGWDGFKQQLDEFKHALDEGTSFYCQLYVPLSTQGQHTILRYGRRYPSFRGPNPDARGLVLWAERFRYSELKHE